MEVKASKCKKKASHEDGKPLTKRYLLKAAEKLDKKLVKNCLVFYQFSISKTGKNWGNMSKSKTAEKLLGSF